VKLLIILNIVLLAAFLKAAPPEYQQVCLLSHEELNDVFKMSYADTGASLIGPECLNLAKDVDGSALTKNFPLASISRAYRHKVTGEIIERHLMAILYSKLEEATNKYDYITDVRASSNNCILNYGDTLKDGKRIAGAHITGKSVDSTDACLEMGNKFGPPAVLQSSKEVWLIFEGRFLQTYQ
jgi:hypothetical protein